MNVVTDFTRINELASTRTQTSEHRDHRTGLPAHVKPNQRVRAFHELHARRECGLDREVCFAEIGAYTKSGKPGIGLTQIGAWVHELEELGCTIEKILLPGHEFKSYFLRSWPEDILDRIHHYRTKRPIKSQQSLNLSSDRNEVCK
jgi:hypothetical protein